MKPVDVGVVGVGEMGRRHAENLRRAIPQARLLAVADIDLRRAQTVAAELEIDAAYASADERRLETKRVLSGRGEDRHAVSR